MCQGELELHMLLSHFIRNVFVWLVGYVQVHNVCGVSNKGNLLKLYFSTE